MDFIFKKFLTMYEYPSIIIDKNVNGFYRKDGKNVILTNDKKNVVAWEKIKKTKIF